MKQFRKSIYSSKAQTKTSTQQSQAKLDQDDPQQNNNNNIFENEQNGKIAPKDLKAAMQILAFEQNVPKIVDVLKELDLMENDITFQEYLDLLSKKLSEQDVNLVIQKIFQLFNEKSTETLSFQDLKKMAKDLDKDISSDLLQELLERASSNGKEITFEDFHNIMTKKIF